MEEVHVKKMEITKPVVMMSVEDYRKIMETENHREDYKFFIGAAMGIALGGLICAFASGMTGFGISFITAGVVMAIGAFVANYQQTKQELKDAEKRLKDNNL